jgi:DNA ligase-1
MVKQATLASFFGNATTSSATGDRKQKVIPSSVSIVEQKETQTNLVPPPVARVTNTSKAVPDDSLNDTDDDDDDDDDNSNDGNRAITPRSKQDTTCAESRRKKGSYEKEVSSRRKRQKILEDSSDEEMDGLDDKECTAENDKEESVLKANKKGVLTIDKETDDENDHQVQEKSETNDESEVDSYVGPEENAKDLQGKSEISKVPTASKKATKEATKDDHTPSMKSFLLPRDNSNSNGNTKNNAASSAAALLSCTKSILSDKSCLQDAPIPYAVLCKTLSEIESISSRLEIQKHLTNLFRLCLLRNPKDLISLIYLASNTVAAAYECVELGIGDSILIKAIGEASGSNQSMIKQKYEADGDLGTVAMTAKGKQRTLGFGIKPKPLAANEVLSVFRQIAMTTGAQSQKWKISKIKGLLVRVQDPMESKYIIRGLQGKLRIGLAQSTVLISLAHAVLLSGTVEELTKDDLEKQHPLSSDCKNVRNKKLALEVRLESAVNIVKKAYSEVSSFDAVVDALLEHPLSILNEKCTLKPGIPVEPMLAKPTKSIQEVLKRLNGKRFTCEFKYDGERAQVHMDSNGVTKVSFIGY